MGIEDEDFDMLAGTEGEDEGAADAIAELDTGDNPDESLEQENTNAEEEADVQGDEDDVDTTDTNQGGGQTVPLAVLLDERKQFQQRMDALNEKAAKFDAFQERFEKIQAERDKPAPEPEPEYLDDPKAYVDHKVGKAEERAETAEERAARLEEQAQARDQMQQITNRLTTFDTEFSKDNQDYYDAMDHVRNINIENIRAMGANEQQAQAQAGQAMFIAQVQAMKQGVNPAEYMYNMAKRFGYTPKADDTADTDTQDAKDDAIIAGQEAGSMGGGAAPDAERDEEMDDDEFTEAFSELFGTSPR